MQSLESQVFAFIVTVMMGITVGVLFDSYNVTKGFVCPRKVVAYVSDLLFWVITTVVVFFMLLVGNWGELRFYVLLGVIVGIILYIKLLSRIVVWGLTGLIIFIKKLVKYFLKTARFAWFVITYPFILAGNIVVIPIGYIGNIVSAAGRLAKRFIRKAVFTPFLNRAGSVRKTVRRVWHGLFKKK
ncbi:MAG: spore cortex biosynthesis protein YabQ [Firmicutes bacterium HGW-Firmicutes-14]|jgi:spore cortex biosynthesis protein YabQ|nr:MAG: spore cortex biosynthesis protein YabQ [Firmicutes bacterium HGW-Firmicutes-14]